MIYRQTRNLPNFLLGQSKIESTVLYLGIEVDDAVEIAEMIEISSASYGAAELRDK